MMRIALVFAALLLSGCSRNPSLLFDHAGPHAAWTASLFWLFFAVSAVVWTAVLAALGMALWRSANKRAPREPEALTRADPLLARWVTAAIGMTVLILTALVGATYAIDRQLIALDQNP